MEHELGATYLAEGVGPDLKSVSWFCFIPPTTNERGVLVLPDMQGNAMPVRVSWKALKGIV